MSDELKESLGTMDRLTQLQIAVDRLAEICISSLGVLQRDAGRIQVDPNIPVTPAMTDHEVTLAREVAQHVPEWASDLAKQALQVEVLVSHLPDLALSETEQLEKISALELENQEAGQALMEEVRKTGIAWCSPKGGLANFIHVIHMLWWLGCIARTH
ncbi:hypothetical protein DFJ74DRAFT_395388 [Hyaloraphidium curvatum]|nr:hypothetical protein DFJ74DRAFT_395388 [Hyaloraphidium curvatum]